MLTGLAGEPSTSDELELVANDVCEFAHPLAGDLTSLVSPRSRHPSHTRFCGGLLNACARIVQRCSDSPGREEEGHCLRSGVG